VSELILATDPDVEGDATALYLAKMLRRPDLKISRIARGLPAGADIDFADEVTLARALEGRVEV
jgi:recombination protein RecR